MNSNKHNDFLVALEDELVNELANINQTKEQLEHQVEQLRIFKQSSLLPQEGETVSYKLGKVLLETNIKNFYLLPKRLLAVRQYAKYRKSLIRSDRDQLQEINVATREEASKRAKFSVKSSHKEAVVTETVANTVECPVSRLAEDIKCDTELVAVTAKKQSEPKSTTKSVKTILAITNSQNLSLYSRIAPTYHLMENNATQLEKTTADIFLVESVWFGIKHQWEYALNSRNMNSIQAKKFVSAVAKLKQKALPVVFIYNEKTKHYDKFKSAIRLVDIVLSANEIVLTRLSTDFKDKRIGQFPKSVALTYCNPSNPMSFTDKGNVVYFGEYSKHFNDDNLSLLKPFLDFPSDTLSVFRNTDAHNALYDETSERWELMPQNHSFEQLIEKLKSFKFSLYIAEQDEADIPQKILDSLACGVPVISTKNAYLEEKLKGIVSFVDTPKQLSDILKQYENNRWEHSRLAHKGFRFVMQNFPAHSLRVALENEVNGRKINPDNRPLVSIIMATMREKYIDRIVTNIARQTYLHKECVIITQNFSEQGVALLREKLKQVENLVRFEVIENNSDATLGERQNQAAKHAKGSLLAKFDDDDFYFENYLADMILPFQFGNYDMVGKAEVFFYLEALNKTVLVRDGKANRELDFVNGPTFIIKRSTFDKLGGFIAVNQSEDSDLLKRVKALGGKVYSADSFNFVQFRSKEIADHTWKQKADAFLKSSLYVGEGIPSCIVQI